MTSTMAKPLSINDQSYIRIQGGKQLYGTTYTDKSKNAILQLMAASILLQNDFLTLDKIPEITDVFVMKNILSELGLKCTYMNETLKLGGLIRNCTISQDLASEIRASIVLLGAMLTTYGEVELPLPGGDKIGNRPVDIHIECLSELGVDFTISNGVIHGKAKCLPLKGSTIFMRFPSVLATGNLIMAAALADGVTKIQNAACEPEIVDLAVLLNSMGAKIKGAGTNEITVSGVTQLHGIEYEPIPDRIETGTLLVAMVITGGHGCIEQCIPEHNSALLSLLKSCGAQITASPDGYIEIKESRLIKPLNAIAMTYPGIPTDLQPMITCLATQCPGTSTVTDCIYPERFAHVTELQKLGAEIMQNGNKAIIYGGRSLNGAYIEGNDIRCVTSLICAGLVANGETNVKGLKHLQRGHANLLQKLICLNADIDFF